MQTIAILLTCYNRINSTLLCFEYLFGSTFPDNFDIDIYLVDDNSPDQTGKIIKYKYPKINLIQGTGELYWNGGMRLAWDTAAKTKDYDFFIWLNDDTYIEKHAIKTLLNDFSNLKNQNTESLIIGSLRDPDTKKITYVGRNKGQIIEPNGVPQECDSIPGNLVLVSKNIYAKVGNLSNLYSHGFGDTDYGLRALQNGFKCNISSVYVGYCKANDKLLWHNPTLKFSERKEVLFAKTGGNICEYLKYVKYHRGRIQMIFSATKTLIRLFLPKYFN